MSTLLQSLWSCVAIWIEDSWKWGCSHPHSRGFLNGSCQSQLITLYHQPNMICVLRRVSMEIKKNWTVSTLFLKRWKNILVFVFAACKACMSSGLLIVLLFVSFHCRLLEIWCSHWLFVLCTTGKRQAHWGDSAGSQLHRGGRGGSLTNIIPHQGRKIIDSDDIITWGGGGAAV